MDLFTWLVLGHIIGTVLGVGAGTFIEIHLNMALADGKINPFERAYMGKDFLVSRIGLLLCILSGLGFLWYYYAHNVLEMRTMDGVFWAKAAIIVVLVVNAYLLHKHKIGIYWGSALSLVSWWAVLLFGVFLSNSVKFMPQNWIVSFAVLMVIYAIVVVVGAWVLHRIREHTKSKAVVASVGGQPPAAPTPNTPQH